jgi:two-component system CheB/CheR fusion protein
MTRFPVVGIGASAGGLAALKEFFQNMPVDSGMAFVVVQHLDPTADSHLAELLGRSTAMPVVSAKEGMRVRPDHVYTIVPDAYLRIVRGVLHLERPQERRGMRSPIDVFFRSLADDLAERAICLVLSGAGTDGTAGVRAIKAIGGLAIAQDPATAQYPAMPISASTAGLADTVLRPADMPKALLGYAQASTRASKSGGRDELNGVLSMILARTGHDFRNYKKSTLTRRIYRRMGLVHTETLRSYVALLGEQPTEVRTLVRDLLINVTGFFRDPEAWQVLATEVIRPLVSERSPDETVRIWVPACATGEEAYSIGMLVLDEMQAQGKALEVKIFATDAEQEVVSHARGALYPATIAGDIAAERLSRFFDHEGDSYRVKRLLREMVTFAPHNILRDPPFSQMDLVTCRNVLIYLDHNAQRRVTALLHFALRENGTLFLGSAETVDRNELFEPISKKWHIYRRVGGTRHDLVDFSLSPVQKITRSAIAYPRMINLSDHARAALAELYAPPSVLIDEKMRVLLFHGDTDRFLRQPPGEPTDALLSLAREGLRSHLRTVIQLATRDRTAVASEAATKTDAGSRNVRITAAPMHGPLEHCLLVTFTALDVDPSVVTPVAQATQVTEGSLEEELEAARAELRSTIEQLEVSNEELKASNEEITSINEELQSTNEELETSREELQSLNEELSTVNSQLQSKVRELEEHRNDLNNLLKATNIATLFLDGSLRIRGFTPAMTDLLGIRASDIGRPFEELARRFDDAELIADARRVLQDLTAKEAEIQDMEGRWYARRMVPYRTDDDRIQGVVTSFIEITERHAWEQRLQAATEYAEHVLSAVRLPMVVLDKDLRARAMNDSFGVLVQLATEKIMNRPIGDFADGIWSVPAVRELVSDVFADGKSELSIEAAVQHAKFGWRTMEVHARRIDFDSTPLVLLGVEDITERRAADRRLRFVTSELLHRVRNILGNVRVIASQSRDHSDTLAEFWESFSGRLDSLASIHGMLAISRDASVALGDLLLEELRAYSMPSDERHTLRGPGVELRADAAQTFGMIIHELTTNSAKYGALSSQRGFLEISWEIADEKLVFDWVERGVPGLEKPTRRGFGTVLIEEGVPYALSGKSRLTLHPEGIACSIEVPLGPKIRPTPGDEVSKESYGGV